jgi:hypothetical protein
MDCFFLPSLRGGVLMEQRGWKRGGKEVAAVHGAQIQGGMICAGVGQVLTAGSGKVMGGVDDSGT